MEILSINLLEKIWEEKYEKKSVFRFFYGVHGGWLTILSFFVSQKNQGCATSIPKHQNTNPLLIPH